MTWWQLSPEEGEDEQWNDASLLWGRIRRIKNRFKKENKNENSHSPAPIDPPTGGED